MQVKKELLMTNQRLLKKNAAFEQWPLSNCGLLCQQMKHLVAAASDQTYTAGSKIGLVDEGTHQGARVGRQWY